MEMVTLPRRPVLRNRHGMRERKANGGHAGPERATGRLIGGPSVTAGVAECGASARRIRCRFRIRDMVGLRYAGRRNGRSVGASSAGGLLRRLPRSGADVLVGVIGGRTNGFVGAEPTLVELGLRIGMTVELVGRALTSLAGPDLLSLPVRLGEGGIAALVPTGIVIERGL